MVLHRTFVPLLPRFLIYNRFNAWGKQREMPTFPKQSFSEAFAKRKTERAAKRD